ncbi:MAG TPA: M20/M25/M40 family metallo-hydrolase [Gaiellales bacterium]|jgi:acetylornithine deacetylase/succinyl-diaminopimelate desuccinylase-like protein|nr:M20/M25/M40 family metallo-hydrolase [Gaiellales bacterium]
MATEEAALPGRVGQVQAWLDDRGDEMAALLERLVAIDSENPPGRGLGLCGRVLHDAMAELGLSPELIALPPARELEEPCIVRGSAGAGARTVYFHGHFDVVPAQSREQFRARRADGRITGRGSADMKGGLVSMLYGAAAAQALGLLGDGTVVLHLVCDEETGSVTGSGHLREAGMIDARAVAMVTPEPTGGVVWHASRGAITLRVEVEGRPAHVGQAHLGVNAFEQMVTIAGPLAQLARDLLERRTAYPLERDEARGSMLVVGGASGSGANFNVVPGSAWFSVDRRFNPEEDLDEEVERLTRTIEDAASRIGARVHIDLLQRQPSAGTQRDHPAALALGACVAAVEGERPRFELCPGVLETRWYAQLGIPAFAYGAGRLDVSHGPDEYIDEAAMRRCGAVYALFAAAALR